ncbi:MAG: HEAT repeat domain-containing protein, partial [Isosphaeraceae bacterium]
MRGIGAEAEDAAPELVKLLVDPDRYVRAAATKTLGGPLGFVTKDIITPRLVELLKDSSDDVRRSAIEVLGGIGAE